MKCLSDITKDGVSAFTLGSGSNTLSANTASIATPSADQITLYAEKQGGRTLPAFKGDTGMRNILQNSFAYTSTGIWNAAPGTSTVPGIVGFPVLTAVGTATSRPMAVTNVRTRMRRIGYVSAATAAAFAAVRSTVHICSVGVGDAIQGGFHYTMRFNVSDAATVSGARMFNGLMTSVAAPTNVEPNTLIQCIGVAQLSTDATQWYLIHGGTSTTSVALGTALGAPTDINTVWDMTLFSPPDILGICEYELKNLGTGKKASGIITPASQGVQLPNKDTLLAMQCWRTNNATAAAVAFDINYIYVETLI